MAADPAHVAHQLGWSPTHVADAQDLLLAARQLGLKAKRSRSSAERLALVGLPALAFTDDGAGTARVVVLAQCDGQRVLFQDPSETIQGGRPVIEPLAAFATRWTGELILITSRASLAGALANFDFSWFIPSLVKYRRLFGEVLVVSLFLQLFALVSPLFFQVVMDKVLVHRGLTTLDVLVVGLTIVVIFESALTVLRTYVLGRGYGAELVQENDSTASNTDVLTFLSGVASDQIWFRHVGNDLQVSIIGTSDRATLQNWYSGSQYHVEEFKTADGQFLLDSKVQDLVSAMAAFAPPALGQTSLPTSYTALIPVIASNWDGSFASTAQENSLVLPSNPGAMSADALKIASSPEMFESALWAPAALHMRLSPDVDPANDTALHAGAAGLINAMAVFSASSDAGTEALPTHTFHALPVMVSPLAL